MDHLQLPLKRRRTRAAAAAEEAASKRAQVNLGDGSSEAELTSEIADDAKRAVPSQTSATDDTTAIPHDGLSMPFATEASHSTSQDEAPSQEVTLANAHSGSPAAAAQVAQNAIDFSAVSLGFGQFSSNWPDPDLQLRIQSLPVLENLSVQILETLSKGSYQETLTVVSQANSGPGRAYATLRCLFDQTKKLYSADEPFLSAAELSLFAPEHVAIIRKANLATFVASVFGSQDVGFYHLNEYFLETFVPDGGRLLKSQGALYLELKTQAYISAMSTGERARDEIVKDLFPDDMEQRILSRRMGAKALNPSEVDFVKRARSRRDHLLSHPDTDEAIAALPDKYVWDDFLRDVSAYLRKHAEELLGGRVSALASSRVRVTTLTDQVVKTPRTPRARQPSFPMSNTESQPQLQPAQNDLGQPAEQAQPGTAVETDLPMFLQSYPEQPETGNMDFQDAVDRAAQAAQAVLQSASSAPANVHDHLEQPHVNYSAGQLAGSQPEAHTQPAAITPSLGGVPEIPYPTQSAPTQILYERARLVATSKSTPDQRRSGLQSQRRPWTTEEENALMAGLDRVRGPHWSQILAMFGAGGTINETLKDRNQVQLKDKARNLKLFFLKSGIEVPYYLQCVTGELKTRAPAQAARQEAKEKSKRQTEEDRAHIEGVLALVGSGSSGGAKRENVDDGAEPGGAGGNVGGSGTPGGGDAIGGASANDISDARAGADDSGMNGGNDNGNDNNGDGDQNKPQENPPPAHEQDPQQQQKQRPQRQKQKRG